MSAMLITRTASVTSTSTSRQAQHPKRRIPCGRSKRTTPPDTRSFLLPFKSASFLQLSILVICSYLCLSTIPCAAAQTTASSSTTTTSTSSSASLSSSASSSATPTYSLSNIPTTLSLPPLNASSPVFQLSLPNVPSLLLTLSICSLTSNISVIPTVLISTSNPPSFSLGSKSVSDSASGGVSSSGWNRRSSKSGTTWEITWDKGFGNWTYTGTGEAQVGVLIGLRLGTDGTLDDDADDNSLVGNVLIQLGASSTAPVHALAPVSPLLGDTTNVSALIFSPLLLSSPQTQPSYPNYTLPGNQLVFSSFDTALSTSSLNSSLSSNLTLIVIPTSSSPTNDGLDNAYCAISQSINSTGNVAGDVVLQSDQPQWMSVGGEEGYRSYWVIGDLISQTNYTAWVRDSSGVLSSPMWFTTKEDTFPCQLVMPTSLCPSIGYSAPFTANGTSTSEGTSTISPIQVLPDDITQVLTSQLEAFSTSLLSQACGRDLYSHVSTCLDCYSAYRDWLCRIVIPQCGSTNSSSSSITTTSSATTPTNGLPSPSTILRTPSTPRNSLLSYPYEYTEILPCLSTCNAADRTCPSWLAFRCPSRSVNAARSYAFTGKDESKGDGGVGTGVPAYDKWGNRWCNG